MARPTAGASARTHFVNVRLTAAGLEALDRMRGGRSRSDFIRELLAAHAAATPERSAR